MKDYCTSLLIFCIKDLNEYFKEFNLQTTSKIIWSFGCLERMYNLPLLFTIIVNMDKK